MKHFTLPSLSMIPLHREVIQAGYPVMEWKQTAELIQKRLEQENFQVNVFSLEETDTQIILGIIIAEDRFSMEYYQDMFLKSMEKILDPDLWTIDKAPDNSRAFLLTIKKHKEEFFEIRAALEDSLVFNSPSKLNVPIGKVFTSTVESIDVRFFPCIYIEDRANEFPSLLDILIFGLFFRATPDEIRFLFADQTGDYSRYEDMPHLFAHHIRTKRETDELLLWIRTEIMSRLSAIEERKAISIDGYNASLRVDEQSFARILIVINPADEYIDDLEFATLLRLVREYGVSVGIHLALITQKPIPTALLSKNSLYIRRCIDAENKEQYVVKHYSVQRGMIAQHFLQACYLDAGDTEKIEEYLKNNNQTEYLHDFSLPDDPSEFAQDLPNLSPFELLQNLQEQSGQNQTAGENAGEQVKHRSGRHISGCRSTLKRRSSSDDFNFDIFPESESSSDVKEATAQENEVDTTFLQEPAQVNLLSSQEASPVIPDEVAADTEHDLQSQTETEEKPEKTDANGSVQPEASQEARIETASKAESVEAETAEKEEDNQKEKSKPDAEEPSKDTTAKMPAANENRKGMKTVIPVCFGLALLLGGSWGIYQNRNTFTNVFDNIGIHFPFSKNIENEDDLGTPYPAVTETVKPTERPYVANTSVFTQQSSAPANSESGGSGTAKDTSEPSNVQNTSPAVTVSPSDISNGYTVIEAGNSPANNVGKNNTAVDSQDKDAGVSSGIESSEESGVSYHESKNLLSGTQENTTVQTKEKDLADSQNKGQGTGIKTDDSSSIPLLSSQTASENVTDENLDELADKDGDTTVQLISSSNLQSSSNVESSLNIKTENNQINGTSETETDRTDNLSNTDGIAMVVTEQVSTGNDTLEKNEEKNSSDLTSLDEQSTNENVETDFQAFTEDSSKNIEDNGTGSDRDSEENDDTFTPGYLRLPTLAELAHSKLEGKYKLVTSTGLSSDPLKDVSSNASKNTSGIVPLNISDDTSDVDLSDTSNDSSVDVLNKNSTESSVNTSSRIIETDSAISSTDTVEEESKLSSSSQEGSIASVEFVINSLLGKNEGTIQSVSVEDKFGLPEGMRTSLKLLDRGDDILQVKERLAELGYYQETDFHNQYNSTMEEKVRQFQEDNGLPVTGVLRIDDLKVLFGA